MVFPYIFARPCSVHLSQRRDSNKARENVGMGVALGLLTMTCLDIVTGDGSCIQGRRMYACRPPPTLPGASTSPEKDPVFILIIFNFCFLLNT